MLPPRWKAITESQFPHEREALEFVRERLPDHEPYRAWSNFEFLTEGGRIYEVDLLVLSPKGFFLIEIKSRPGVIEGDSHTWIWSDLDRRHTADNPLLLTDRKAKALKSLLGRQRSCRKIRVPFLQPVVFCSHRDQQLRLDAAARHWVFTRDTEAAAGEPARPGIVAALTRWTPGGAGDPGPNRVDKPTARAIDRALEEAGIRPSQRARRVGDYVLGELLEEGPTYQDWAAEHASAKGVRARVRLCPSCRGCPTPASQPRAGARAASISRRRASSFASWRRSSARSRDARCRSSGAWTSRAGGAASGERAADGGAGADPRRGGTFQGPQRQGDRHPCTGCVERPGAAARRRRGGRGCRLPLVAGGAREALPAHRGRAAAGADHTALRRRPG